jgi:hypothetical protein
MAEVEMQDMVLVEDAGASSSIAGKSAPRTREEVQAIAAMTSPWVEKYRPESLSDVIAHHDIVATREFPRSSCCLSPLRRFSSALFQEFLRGFGGEYPQALRHFSIPG